MFNCEEREREREREREGERERERERERLDTCHPVLPDSVGKKERGYFKDFSEKNPVISKLSLMFINCRPWYFKQKARQTNWTLQCTCLKM